MKLKEANYDGTNYVTNRGELHAGYFSTSYEEAHKNEVDSDIKIKLDNWYQDNLLQFDSYLADAGFCNDRSLYSGVGFYNGNHTFYGAYGRLMENKNPQFSCPNPKNDLFTVSNSKGNKSLKYKIGLITGDEVAYAGAVNGVWNRNYYLCIEASYWTMTPLRYSRNEVTAVNTTSRYSLEGPSIYSNNYIRPVINLNAKVEITDINQDGTINNPYIIKLD